MSKRFSMFILGGALYTLTELLWRGRTHRSMFVLGGLCFLSMGLINRYKGVPLAVRGILGAAVITALELVTGYIVNIRFGLDVWDYSGMPYNIMGQICLTYSLLWYAVSVAALIAYEYITECLFE